MFICQKNGLIIRSEGSFESTATGYIPYGEQVTVTGRED